MAAKIFRRSSYIHLRRKLFPYKRPASEFYDALYIAANGATLFVPENIYCIDLAIKNLPSDDPVIEIGSFTGMSTCMLIHYLAKHGRDNLLFNADRWDFEEREKNYYVRVLGVSPEGMKTYIRDSFIRNLRMFCGNRLPHTIEMFSDDFFECWQADRTVQDIWGRPVRTGGPVSFAYLDGNHQYAFVKRDFEHVDKYLVKGGFVFFDDSDRMIKTGVHEFVKELLNSKDYEVVARNPNYLFRKVR